MDQIMKNIRKSEEGGKEETPVKPPRKTAPPPVIAKKSAPEPAEKKKKEPVFFKDEYMAVRNPDNGFYICKAMQNIYIGSRNIKIQWYSNEPHIIPAKDNPQGDIYAPDFYDKTDFETVLTSVEMDRVLGKKSKRQIFPEEESERINKILQRANDKAAGKLEQIDNLLTEDNPDGLDISLYQGEDQLDEIEQRRKKDDKSKKKGRGKKDEDEDYKGEEQVSNKGSRGRPKKEEDQDYSKGGKTPSTPSRRVEKRKSAEKARDNWESFEFNESSDEEEVMPKPKKRKSQEGPARGRRKEESKEKKEETKESTDKKTEEVNDEEKVQKNQQTRSQR